MHSAVLRSLIVSVLRSLLALSVGAVLLKWQLADSALIDQGLSILAFLIVDKSWEWYTLNQQQIFARLMAIIGLQSNETTPVEVVVAEARSQMRDGTAVQTLATAAAGSAAAETREQITRFRQQG